MEQEWIEMTDFYCCAVTDSEAHSDRWSCISPLVKHGSGSARLKGTSPGGASCTTHDPTHDTERCSG